ncbi:MAG: InlB B-repeat-containing protein [Treponema sp.]
MKKSNSTKKAQSAFRKLGAVALITATLAVCFTACNQTGGTGGGGGKPTPTPKPKHAITFSVDGANGKLTAKADGVAETNTSPITVEEGKTVTFTATANAGYRVKGWTLDGNAVNGTNNSYSFTVSKAVSVKVSFEDDSTPKPKHAITFSVDSTTPNGKLTAKADGVAETNTSPITVEEGKTVIFTATADDGYKIGKWTVTPETALQAGTGADGSESAKVKITADTTVSVSFELLPPGKAILTLESNEFPIKVNAVTADGSAITVEGCNETTLASGRETILNATGTTVILKGKITKLYSDGSIIEYPPLTSLNVQGLPALQVLNCGNNHLTELNVQGCASLRKLDCRNNKLPELNVQGCASLRKLDCRNNKLPELNVQGLTSLQELNCFANKLTELNVQGLTALKKLECGSNQLTALNVQGLIALQELSCGGNKFTELNVQGCTSLKELYCSDNQLTALNVKGLTALQKLNCRKNQLTSLDVQGLTSLQELGCIFNKLTALNVQGLTSLQWLDCCVNQLNAQAMTELLNALPAREAGDKAEATLYAEATGITEGNCKDYNAPPELKAAFDGAKSRNWKLRKYNASGNKEDI